MYNCPFHLFRSGCKFLADRLEIKTIAAVESPIAKSLLTVLQTSYVVFVFFEIVLGLCLILLFSWFDLAVTNFPPMKVNACIVTRALV